MSAIKKRLAAKARRTVRVPVQVADPGPARERAETARRAVLAAQIAGRDQETIDALIVDREAAEAELAQAFCFVDFVAITPADMERITVEHTDPTTGEIREATCLPVLAAACAVEEDLRDEAWWTEQLTDGAWAMGERVDLWHKLMDLNLDVIEATAPKG